MWLAIDPTRGQSQPRVRAYKARAESQLQGPHFPRGAGSDFREGRLCPRHNMTTRPPSPRNLDTLSSLPSLRPPLPDRQEAGKGYVPHTVYQLNVNGVQVTIF